MADLATETALQNESDYRRAFERVKQANKKLTKDLSKLEAEIKERCQSYMVQIARLKQTKPQIKKQCRLYELQIVPRQVDLKVIGREDNVVCFDKNVSKCEQSECQTQSLTKNSRIISKDFDGGQSGKLTVQTNNTIRNDTHNEQIERIQLELMELRKRELQREERNSRISERISSSSVDEQVSPEHQASVQAFRQFYEQEKRYYDEKLFVYEAVFLNIYNLLMKDNCSLKMVEEIRNVKYDELSVKLKTLFSLIRINQDNVQLIQREKEELLKQLEYLSGRVQEFTKVVKHQVETQTCQLEGSASAKNLTDLTFTPKSEFESSRVRLDSQSYQFRLPFCKNVGSIDFSRGAQDLLKLKNNHLDKIRDLYEYEIERKYQEIAKIKASMHSMLDQLSHCVFSEHSSTKVMRVDRDLIEQDTDDGEHNPYTKRSFVRRRLTKRTISTSKNQSLEELHFNQEDSLITKVLLINKRLAEKARISSVSEEEDLEDHESFVSHSLTNSPRETDHLH